MSNMPEYRAIFVDRFHQIFDFLLAFQCRIVTQLDLYTKKNSCRINRMVNKFLIAYTLRFPRWMRSKFDARGFVRWPVGSIYTFLLIFSYKHTCVHNKKFKHWNNRFHSIQSTFFSRGFWSFPLFQLLYVFFFRSELLAIQWTIEQTFERKK